jgi:hypothetical protein
VQTLLQWKDNEYYTTPLGAFVASIIQHATGMRHIIMWPDPLYNIFYIIS